MQLKAKTLFQFNQTKFYPKMPSPSKLVNESFIYFGGIVGVIVGSILSQYLRKRQMMIVALAVSTIFCLVTLLSPSVMIAVIGLFMNYAMRGIELKLAYCFIAETVPDK